MSNINEKYPNAIGATAKVLNALGESWTFRTEGFEATNFGMMAGNVEWQKQATMKLINAAINCGAKLVVLPIHRADKLRYKVFELKMEQVEATGANTVLSTCSNCRQSYNDAKEHFHWDKNMESLLELVADNLVE